MILFYFSLNLLFLIYSMMVGSCCFLYSFIRCLCCWYFSRSTGTLEGGISICLFLSFLRFLVLKFVC